MGHIDLNVNFYLGHQGWEFIDLGRIWQILLFIGLLLWLVLMFRALLPLFKINSSNIDKNLLWAFILSVFAIGLMYGTSLFWGKHSHISVVEYWRWWVVHLWVEGFFEVFATALIAIIFVKLGLIRPSTAGAATVFSTILFMAGAVLGTMHHLYFSGTTTSALAIGAMVSALEVVPLVLIGWEAMGIYRYQNDAPWMKTYRWPIMFFVAVAFWNLVGAGLFGFLLNPPISLYYIQGLYTTANHAHGSLFGVYGMLGIGFMLFCLRGVSNYNNWHYKYLRLSFWLLNIGLVGMTVMSLLPSGIYQALKCLEHGYWYARSPDVIHSYFMELFVWLRVPGDIIFGLGAMFLALFMVSVYNESHKLND